jgi:hypothetical protein
MKVSSILDDALILCAMSIKSQYSGLMVICFSFLLFYGLAFRGSNSLDDLKNEKLRTS